MFRIKGETFFFRLRKEGDLFFAEAVMLGVKESCEKFMLELSIFDPESKISSSATLVPRPASATNQGEGCLTVHQKTLATIWKHNVEMKSYEFQVSIKVNGPEEYGSEEDTEEDEMDISDGETEWLLEAIRSSPWPKGCSKASCQAYMSHLLAESHLLVDVKRKRTRPGCKRNVLPDRPGYEMLHVDAPFKETLVLLGMSVERVEEDADIVKEYRMAGCLDEDSEEEDEDYVDEGANEETSDEISSSEEEGADVEELQEDEGALGRGD